MDKKRRVSSAHTIPHAGKTPGLKALLDLAGEIYVQEGGYWTKVEAWQVDVRAEIPHGIRYALTLHAPDGSRVMGFDNAHAVAAKKGRFAARRLEFDHWHPDEKEVRPYEFQSVAQLLADFFAAVDRALKQRGVIEP